MGIISEIQGIGAILKAAGKTELYEKLLKIQEDALEIQDKNKALMDEVSRLQEQLRLKATLRFEDNYYFSCDETGKKSGGPFCSHCWDNDKLLIRLHETNIVDYFRCPKCKNSAGKETTIKAPSRAKEKTEYDDLY